jgi:hypothetical protein
LAEKAVAENEKSGNRNKSDIRLNDLNRIILFGFFDYYALTIGNGFEQIAVRGELNL